MSDHYHYEYAEGRHDHRGEYADERHDHDLDYAEKYHRHYDLEREDERLKGLLDQWQAHLRELREDLRDALERIRALEDRQPDYAGPDADDEEAPAAEDRGLPGDLAEAACGGESAWRAVPRLRRRTPSAHDDPHWANGAEMGAPAPVAAVCICRCPECCGHREGDLPAAGDPGRCPGCSCYLAWTGGNSL